MKRKTFPLVLLVLVLFSSAFAAEQIGTVTASGDFGLAGTQVPGSAARSVPLTNGDKVVTTTSTAAIMLEDGSRIAIDQNSALTLQRLGEEMLLCLEKGAMRFNAAEGSRLVVCALARRIEIQALSEGTASIEGPEEVLVNVEKGAPVVVIEDATCTCEPQRRAPFPPFLTTMGTKAVVITTAVAGAAVGSAILASQEGKPGTLTTVASPTTNQQQD